ncbi:MAG: polyprenyl synthetase family protein [Alphaproteobacteria bacterium]|nr:polyprenyl synthetase family protein [Alphaproteobacteria bacterium]
MLDLLLPRAEGPEARLMEAMRYAALNGGKRLRPLLVIASSELFSVSPVGAHRVAAAIEMVHCYSLVHDDLPCMDDDDLRRGLPTVHRKYDEATAVLAGDGLLTLAFEVVGARETHGDPEVRAELVVALGQAAGARGMVGGQAIDLAAEHQQLDIGQITRLQQLKTGALIAFSCEAGAILGKAAATPRHALRAYAHDLGLAFQIVDDILDAEGTVESVGKAVGKDAAAGKATFVSLLGLEKAKLQARMLADQAAKHLDIFDGKADVLRQLAHYVVTRRS